MKKHKVAVIGIRFMGRTHLEALRRIGSVEIHAVAGTSVEKARQLADAFAVDRSTADYRDICTPNALHFPIAEAALRAGKHVLCEKPLATSSSAVQQVFRRFYQSIEDPSVALEYPQFSDGLRQLRINRTHAWADIPRA